MSCLQKLIILTLTLGLPNSAYSKITVFATEHPLYARKVDGKGLFVDILNKVLSNHHGEFKLVILPSARAIKEFQKGEKSCFLGAEIKAFKKLFIEIDGIVSERFFNSKYVLFTLKKDKIIRSTSELSTMVLGVVRGDQNLTKDIKSDAVVIGDLPSLVEMLKLKRIDAIADWYPAEKSLARDLHHDPELYLLDLDEKLVCHNTEAARKLISVFNRGLEVVRKNNGLGGIFKKYLRFDVKN